MLCCAHTAHLAWRAGFNTEKGYGFIQLDSEEKDVFVHQSDIYAPGFRVSASSSNQITASLSRGARSLTL